MIRSFTLSICFCCAMFAQSSGSLGGPVLGYVPEGTAIRALYGLPAAGAIGATVDTGRSFSRIAISPQQNFAIAVAADTGALLIVDPIKASATAIPGVSANPDMLAISPGGTAAAAWFTSLGRMQVVTGLPASPAVATMNAPFLNATPTEIAVSDDGQWAVGVWSAGVYAFGSANIMPLQTDPGVAALAFFHNNHTLAIATVARATSITDVGGANQASILYDYSQQALVPKGIGASFDNQRVLMADVAGKLVNISVAGSSASIVDCGCSPGGVYGLGDALFRLNGTSGRSGTDRSGPTPELKIFDAAAGAVWIVPPALSGVGGRQ